MGLFSKPEYIEVEMDFIYDIYTHPEEFDNGIISIEAYGNILDTYKYVTSSYSLKDMSLYDNGGYEEMTGLLRNTAGKKVRVRFKTKDGKIKDAKILIESLADAYNDERFLKLELLGWGVGDKSFSSQV
ncbi:MAG: hypothetical protein ACI4KD_09380 [Oscillospiraceae bacterium]